MRRKLGMRKDKISRNGPCPLSHLPTPTTVQWGNTEQETVRDETTLQMESQWGQCFTAWRPWLHERHLKCLGQKIKGNI